MSDIFLKALERERVQHILHTFADVSATESLPTIALFANYSEDVMDFEGAILKPQEASKLAKARNQKLREVKHNRERAQARYAEYLFQKDEEISQEGQEIPREVGRHLQRMRGNPTQTPDELWEKGVKWLTV